MIKLKSLVKEGRTDAVIDKFISLLPKYGLEFYSWDNNADNVAFQWRGGTFPTITDKERSVKVALDSTDIFDRNGDVWVGDPSRPLVHGFVVQAIVTDPEHRGRGKAKEMLRKVIQAADEAGLMLKLEPVPMKDFIKKGQKSLTKPQLVQWYKKYGFTPNERGNIMTRKPLSERFITEAELLKLAREMMDEIEELKGKDVIMSYLEEHSMRPEVVVIGSEEFIIFGSYIIDDFDMPSVMEKDDWLWRSNGQRVIERVQDGVEILFNKRFWQYPQICYHATQKEHLESIKQQGLKASDDSRGTTNRHIGKSVFATTEHDEAAMGHYGPIIISINTLQMKQDGYMPEVSREPSADQTDAVNFLAHKLKMWDDGRYDAGNEDGTTPNTIIFHGDIPSKYLLYD